ncbi:NAD-P-binding protein [Lenzites betulinus]|nr:NAD-P-binding protein [Lenzites betulinus]
MASVSHSVVIVGGTGGLGHHISNAFLTEFKGSFHDVRVLTRNPSSAAAQELSAKGASLHKLDESDLPGSLDGAFAGVDVVVNSLPPMASAGLQQGVVDAAARNNVKVYFLSEFGVDYRFDDFPGYEHPEWIRRKKVAVEARELLKGKKVIALFSSVFLELIFSPLLGINVAKNTYTCFGSPTQRITATSKADIGRSIARVSALALDPTTAEKVPDELRVAGSTASYENIRDIVSRVKGVPKGEIKSEDLTQLKERIRQDPGKNFLDYLHVSVGEGKADFTTDNANALVNPAEAFWKWRTIEQHAGEA